MLFIGSKLKAIRVGCKLSLDEAEAITGVPKSTLADIEKGKTQPRCDTVQKICSGFGIMPEYFFLDARLIGLGFENDAMPGMLNRLGSNLMKFILSPGSKPYIEHAAELKGAELPVDVLTGLIKFWSAGEGLARTVGIVPQTDGPDDLEKNDPYYILAVQLKHLGVPPVVVISFWEHMAYLRKKHHEKKK